MNSQYVKIILIALLSVFAVTLFYFYVSSDDKINVKENTENINIVSSKDMILADIDSILYSFGIRKDWIREAAIREKDQKKTIDELTFNKEVRIPQDLPTVDLNYEITNYFRKYLDEIKVTEDPRTKNITMNILNMTDTIKKLVGIIKFVYSDTLKRNAADIALVLDSLDLYSLKEVGEILSSTQAFSVVLPMRNDKADYQAKIIELNRDYLLKLSVGDEDDIEADFKEGMKESIRSSKIKSLSLNFQNVSGVILINKTTNLEFFIAVKNDFIKNNIKIYDESVFGKFRTGENAVVSMFEDIITEAKGGNKALFYDVNFDPEEFASYDRQLYNMKKLGYRFYNFRDLMSRSKQ
jgi:hypothetical protein